MPLDAPVTRADGMRAILRSGEAENRGRGAIGILLRTEVSARRPDLDAPVRQPLGDLLREGRTDVGRRLAAGDVDGHDDLGQLRPRVVERAHRVDGRFDVGPALQLEHAVAAIAYAVVD